MLKYLKNKLKRKKKRQSLTTSAYYHHIPTQNIYDENNNVAQELVPISKKAK